MQQTPMYGRYDVVAFFLANDREQLIQFWRLHPSGIEAS